MTKVLLTLSAFLLLSFTSSAQRYNLSGSVADSIGNAVPFASIALSSPTDTSVVQFTIANEHGKYSMRGVEPGQYLLVSASVGYEVLHYPVNIDRDRSSVDLTMKSSLMSFEEVMVVAKRIPVLMHGDTVVYNSESFKTQANANVEDLIRKMPGINVGRDGGVTVNGQSITKVLINGKEFFGGNIEAATKNLDASLVDKVEVIDKKTDEDEFTGEDSEEREKVINLVLKEEHNQGYFGRISGGYGTDNLYQAHGNINFFRDEHQLSIIGGSNNINERLYGWRDMQTLQSFDITPFNYQNRTWYFSGGVKTYHGVGVNLHTEPIKGMKTDVAYVITREESVKEEERQSQVFLSENTLFSDYKEDAAGLKDDHQLNAKVEYEPDSLNRLVLRTRYTASSSLADNLSRTFNYITPTTILNSGVNRDHVDAVDDKLVAKIHWTRKQRSKPLNHFLGSIYVDVGDASNGYNSYFNTADSMLPVPSNEDPILEQQLKTSVNSLATTAAYQIQLSDKWKIRPGINYLVGQYDHSFKWLDNNGELDAMRSPIGQVKAQNMEYYMHISYQVDSFTSIYFVPEINQNVESRRFTSDEVHEYQFNQFFFIPYMWIRSKKDKVYTARFSIRGTVNKPSVEQIIPITDNSDPYRSRVGNIELQNNIRYTNSWNYMRMFNIDKFVSIGGWTNYSIRPVTLKQSVNDENYSSTEYVNYKDNIFSGQRLTIGFPIKRLEATFGLNADYNFNQAYSIRNDEEVMSRNQSVGFGPDIEFNGFDLWSLSLEYNYNYNQGSIGGIDNNPFFDHTIDAELILNPIDRIEWSSELYLEMYSGNTTSNALLVPLWSSTLTVFVDKNKRWSLGVQAFDILNQNQNIWRWWDNNMYIENRSNSMTRYVMGHLTYKISKPKPKKKDGDLPKPVDKTH